MIRQLNGHAFSCDVYVKLSRWRTACFLLLLALIGTVYWGCIEMADNKANHAMRREEIVAAAARLASDTPERMECLFDSARSLHVEEAIPLAVLYATRDAVKDGHSQYHVLAARRYLLDFDVHTIEQQVHRARHLFANPAAIMSKLPEVLK